MQKYCLVLFCTLNTESKWKWLMNVYKQHYSKSDKSEKVAADMNVVDQRQHNKRKRIQRQRMFAKKRKKIHYNILDKKNNFTFRGLSRTVRHAKVYFYIYMKCVVKLTAIPVVARLCLWTVASANWCASTVLSKVATPISAPCLRVSWKKKCGTLSVRVTLTPSPHVLLQLAQGPQEAQEECRRGGAKWDFDEINFRFHFYFKEGSK